MVSSSSVNEPLHYSVCNVEEPWYHLMHFSEGVRKKNPLKTVGRRTHEECNVVHPSSYKMIAGHLHRAAFSTTDQKESENKQHVIVVWPTKEEETHFAMLFGGDTSNDSCPSCSYLPKRTTKNGPPKVYIRHHQHHHVMTMKQKTFFLQRTKNTFLKKVFRCSTTRTVVQRG